MLSYILWLVLLLIYYKNILGYDADIKRNSMCLNNKCVNRLHSRRQINSNIRMLGKECEKDDDCRQTPVDGTKICLSQQCQCSPGHVPIDAYRCIQDLEQLSSNIQVTKVSEIEESPGYGSLCSTNTDCQHTTTQLECLRGTCVCLEGYVPLGKYLCYNIRGQGAPMIESSTLTSTLSTISDLSNNKIAKSLGDPCTSDNDCRQSLIQSQCYNGKCSCINGYISLDSVTCIKNTDQDISSSYKSLLGGKCLTNKNCHTLDARCFNNICICPNGYYPIDDWHCLQDSDSPNAETTTKISPSTTVFRWWPWEPLSTIKPKNKFPLRCLLNEQCTEIDSNSHCKLSGRCVCNIGYRLDVTNKEQKCVREIINEEDCD